MVLYYKNYPKAGMASGACLHMLSIRVAASRASERFSIFSSGCKQPKFIHPSLSGLQI